MPAADPKLVELSRLKSKLSEVETQLKEQKKLSMKLRDNTEKRIREISVVDAEIVAELERFRWKREEAIVLSASFSEDATSKLALMKEEEYRILEEIAGFDVIEEENKKLYMKLKEVSKIQVRLVQAQIAERESKKQKNFDTRMAMEESFRKVIKHFDDDYQAEAVIIASTLYLSSLKELFPDC